MQQILALTLIKIISMIAMFLMIMIAGNIPLKSTAFKENKLILSLTGAFSGGLFLSVGIIHLMPEAQYFFTQDWISRGHGNQNQFPYSSLITVLSFGLILYIERILFTKSDSHTHSTHSELQNEFNADKSTKENEKIENQESLTPYILQVAIGIHAVFEGLAIGIETEVAQCLGIALAVICHKWAEGLTLGLAFRKSGTQYSSASRMITIQAIMNPIGIAFGWILSDQGYLISGIFDSISAGTFIYIATMEVIQQEFSKNEYKYAKMIMFLLAVVFISSIWQLEQLSL